MLSGLVLARSYEKKLSSSMSFFGFAKARLIRLYPLFLLGLFIDAVRKAWRVLSGIDQSFTLEYLATSFFKEMVFIPTGAGQANLYWLNPPAWSLVQELLVNAVFALVLFKLSTRLILVITSVTFILFLFLALSIGDFDVGSLGSTAHLGFVRALFGFTAGMLIGRLGPRKVVYSWGALAPCVALLGLLCLPKTFSVSIFSLLFSIPLLVLIGSIIEPPRVIAALFKMLGESSYPMYAIHYPLIFLAHSTLLKMGLVQIYAVAIPSVGMIAMGILTSRFYDIPIRYAINKNLKAKRVKNNLSDSKF